MRRLVCLAGALLVGSTASLVVAAGPAAAAACPKGTGVTVVVESNVSCDANGGGPASANFTATGHTLTPVSGQPGFVCQVDGVPESSCVRTPPADAYWGLFWSDGTSGTWKYASQGVASLSIPDGGWVGFAFQDDASTKKLPGVKPLGTAPAPATTKPPKAGGGSGGGSGGGGGSAKRPSPTAPSASATVPTASPTDAATTKPTRKPAEVTATPTDGSTPTYTISEDPTTSTSSKADADDGSGALGWVAGGLGVGLVAGMGVVLWRRRVASGP